MESCLALRVPAEASGKVSRACNLMLMTIFRRHCSPLGSKSKKRESAFVRQNMKTMEMT
jgi:hypothetical protein